MKSTCIKSSITAGFYNPDVLSVLFLYIISIKKCCMEQSGGKSTLNTLNNCKPCEYWNSIDVLFSEIVHCALQKYMNDEKVHLAPENFSQTCNLLNT